MPSIAEAVDRWQLSIAGPGCSIAVADCSCPEHCCARACSHACVLQQRQRRHAAQALGAGFAWAEQHCPGQLQSPTAMEPGPAIDRCTPRPRWKDAPRACDGRMHHAPAMDGCTPRPRSTQPVPAMRPTGRVVMCVGRCEFEPLRSRFFGRNKETATVHGILWYPCGYPDAEKRGAKKRHARCTAHLFPTHFAVLIRPKVPCSKVKRQCTICQAYTSREKLSTSSENWWYWDLKALQEPAPLLAVTNQDLSEPINVPPPGGFGHCRRTRVG